jgi:Ni,Fe-hydrogenase I large subunit
MCQTHHRQLLTTGMVNPIRAYRKRSAGTVKFAGLRLSASCVETVKAFAKARGISDGAAVAQLLEDWNVKGAPWPVRDDD